MIGHLPEDELRRKRVKRVKALLRPMPRKANLHRYPVLKYFASYARKCTYLWTFREQSVTRAIYIGWLISLIPMYGLQMISAFILCMIFRANAIVAMMLQWITNPITIAPIFYIQYKVGEYIYTNLFDITADSSDNIVTKLQTQGFEALLDSLKDLNTIKLIIMSMGIGALVLAPIGAGLTHILYKLYLSKFKNRLRKLKPNLKR